MIPDATTTITVYRANPAVLGLASIDPWVKVQTDAVFPGAVIATHVRAAFVKPSETAQFDGGAREQTNMQCRCDPTDIEPWDRIVDDATFEVWRIVGVVQRVGFPGSSLAHTAMSLVRVEGAA